ncbi:hypothetical protein RHMOL_Rhmol05G0234900 [Rhododendron molle]|uniref:Uncharacterized protein n=1 Tax=Rhododendron molle TaxID=49168 RepID=A0ACC0NUF6_RHOML|nr:hypothetical protein RHMOL_Rhmol05G0234900 [Rhododendron molle]
MTKYRFFVSRQDSCLYEQDQEATSDSDDSEVESPSGELYPFMDKSVEGALLKLTCEHQLIVTEEVRNHVLGLGTDLINENKKFIYALDRVKKCTEAQQEIGRKQDTQYQRKM